MARRTSGYGEAAWWLGVAQANAGLAPRPHAPNSPGASELAWLCLLPPH